MHLPIFVNMRLKATELATSLAISERSIERNIQKLQKENKLERIGPAKGGYWSIKQH